jgi:hypothetical protein
VEIGEGDSGVLVGVGEGLDDGLVVDEGSALIAVDVLLGGAVLGVAVGKSGCVESCVLTAEGVAEDTRPAR